MHRALKRESGGKGSPKWLDVIAAKVIEAAAGGDMAAVREIGDRVDGKPRQQIDTTHDIASPILPTFEVAEAKAEPRVTKFDA